MCLSWICVALHCLDLPCLDLPSLELPSLALPQIFGLAWPGLAWSGLAWPCLGVTFPGITLSCLALHSSLLVDLVRQGAENTKISRTRWHLPLYPGTVDTEAGESLEPRRRRCSEPSSGHCTLARMTAQHSSSNK